jgi:hypothetical protein
MKLALLLSLALLPIATLSAKSKAGKPDFSEFKGNYTGTNVLNIGMTLSGPATIQVAVPGKGRSAVVTINGSVTSGSTTIPLSNTFTLTKSALTASNALFGLTPTSGFTIPGKLSRNGFNATGPTAVNTTPVLIQTTVKVKPKGKKKKTITVTYTISTGTIAYTFQFTGTGKARKN